MTFDLAKLPRAVSLTRGGGSGDADLPAAAASAAAAFVVSENVPEGTPLLCILDQTRLPLEEAYLCTNSWEEVINWIKALKVRGAPAIGVAGAAAVALAAWAAAQDAPERFSLTLEQAAETIARARPTAVNLRWAVRRLMAVAAASQEEGRAPQAVAQALICEAQAVALEDEAANRELGRLGAELLEPNASVLTHCNAGSLATAFYGTALGVIYAAAQAGKIERVFADETRPVCQGSRLTAWELSRTGVPVTLICDDMAASVMAQGLVDAVIVGADRIAANGDVANKIGTLGVAVLADHFHIPFYVAAPTSTFDGHTLTGADIVIEQRSAEEVLSAPLEGVEVLNPAFDVTPAALVTAIITERGVFSPSDISRELLPR